jgi:adenosine deaminase
MVDPGIPLADLHRHLEGCIRLETVLELARKYQIQLPAEDLPALQKQVYVTEPTAEILYILPKFQIMTRVMVNYDVCRRIALECLEDAALEGLDYVELRFSPLFMAEPNGLDPQGVTSVVCEAWQEACHKLPIHSRLIVIMSRTYGPEACEIELNAALSHRERGVVGLDLAGDEARHPANQFVRHFQRAREAGLHLIAHAGEFAGAESVRDAVLQLGVERIGHGVHAVDDPEVIDLLAERRVAIECCPTSNLYTCAVPSLEVHPLPIFLRHGILATLNTDDPTLFFQIHLRHEYEIAHTQMGIDVQGLQQIQRNGILAAFLTESERVSLQNAKRFRKKEGSTLY